MPKPFHQLSLEQFVELLSKFPFKRRIDSIHMHHTWRPNHAQYRGLETIEGMWSYHTREKKWSDIAQHISIAPDGMIWTGRNWDQPPASAIGYNGNAKVGPFMFEIIGDFDRGKDAFEGTQKETVLAVIAHLQKQFGLDPGTLRFHNTMSSKSCPGTAIDYKTILKEVAQVRQKINAKASEVTRSSNFPFADKAREVWKIIDEMRRDGLSSGIAQDEGEGCDHGHQLEEEFERTTLPVSGDASRGRRLTPEDLRHLRPHVINLNQGMFSRSGTFQTQPGDVDAIFEEYLHDWARSREGEKLRLVFFAHGGLVSEQSGLMIAQNQLNWWLENGIYPIHFVWETGLMETLGQLLNPSRRRALDWFAPTDRAIEALARGIGGVKIWSGMKQSAERASGPDGGARYAAKKLRAFCEHPDFKDRVEMHAVGHSAGSIFHAHFIPAALEQKVPGFASLHFLAPAVRVDTFEEKLIRLIGQGKGIGHLSVFTMAQALEEADNCMSVYRKSLLYLIHFGLEPERRTPILGLEESIRANANLQRLFNLDRRGSGAAEIIWSQTKATGGPSASRSTTHGGFDNDSLTMQSVAHRIIGHEPKPFVSSAARGLSLLESLEAEEPSLRMFFQQAAPPASVPPPSFSSEPAPSGEPPSGSGRKRALCVGIDRYVQAPLAGCVNDARLWRETLVRAGFEEPEMLLDEAATRDAIVRSLERLVQSAQPGDVVVFQFAGHGTQVADLDGDEVGGSSPGLDEALCPFDFHTGRLVIDDDLAAILDHIPAEVNITVFTDCCHSGTITRLAIGNPLDGHGRDVRARFVNSTPQLEAAHASFRRTLETRRSLTTRDAYDQAPEILFSACRSYELALESNGQGHFTTRATRLIAGGLRSVTNEMFQERVLREFGPNPRQNPELHCAPQLRRAMFLAAGTAGGVSGASETRSNLSASPCALREELASVLETAVRNLRQ